MVHVSNYTKNYESHPGKKLSKHITNVQERALLLHNSPIVSVSALTHDVGKLNPNFKLKLEGSNISGLYTSHAYLSLQVFMSIIKESPETVLKLLGTWDNIYSTMICIYRHHGSLPNFNEALFEEEYNRMMDFLKTHPYMPAQELLSLVNLGDFNFDLYDPTIDPGIYFKWHKKALSKINHLNFYLETKTCFSSLISADKLDAGSYNLVDTSKSITNKYCSCVDNFLKTLKPTSPLNIFRTKIRNHVYDNLEKELDNNPSQRVFSITAPTGSGKSAIMISLPIALIKRGIKINKVIYSIPFLTITEQIHDILKKDVFKEKDFLHRIDSKSMPKEETQKSFLSSLKSAITCILMGTSLKDNKIQVALNSDYREFTLNYPVIVTTFVQLFESFTTSSNKGCMRFAHLKNSVFLIDEIQSLPPRMYTFFVAMIDAFCRRYNSYAIISTATMPYFEISPLDPDAAPFFKGYKRPIELSDLSFYKEDIFNRYYISVLKETHNTLSIAKKMLSAKKPTLIVFNTIKDSVAAYKVLRATSSFPVYLINSNFHASDRLMILDKCKKHLDEYYKTGLDKHKIILVSTQLIEAGVDIDFNEVYREIAPLSNIIQTAGRCNREGRRSLSPVYVFYLRDNRGRLRSRCIYNGSDAPLLNFAVTSLPEGSSIQIEEKNLLPLQKSYFNFLSKNLKIGGWSKMGKNRNLILEIVDKKFKEVGEFRLIPKHMYGTQVQYYVPIDDNDKSFENYVQAIADALYIEEHPTSKDHLKQLLGANNKIKKLRKSMMNRVVQATLDENIQKPEQYAEYNECFMELYKILPQYYNSEFGLMF